MSDEVTRRYSKDDLTVAWRAGLCIHCGNCKTGLPAVFDPAKRPWVDLSQATADEVREQVEMCPTGALKVE